MRVRTQVKITNEQGTDINEFGTDDNGDLRSSSVKAIYEGANALKYKTDAGTTRICNLLGDIFEAPVDGWGARIYVVNQPTTQQQPVAAGATGNTAHGGYPGTNQHYFPPAPQLFPGFPGAPPIPRYSNRMA